MKQPLLGGIWDARARQRLRGVANSVAQLRVRPQGGALSGRFPMGVVPGNIAGTVYVVPSDASFKLKKMESNMAALQGRIKTLEDQLGSQGELVVLREISRDDAKLEILKYFEHNPNAYPSDAAIALHLDAGVVRELCEELVGEGRLEG